MRYSPKYRRRYFPEVEEVIEPEKAFFENHTKAIKKNGDSDKIKTVKDYVKWKIYLQPALFNEKLVAYHEGRYEQGRGKLRVSVLTGFSGNAQAQQERFV